MLSMTTIIRKIMTAVLVVSAALVGGCAQMQDLVKLADIQKPVVSFSDAKLSSLSFHQADLIFNLKIDNPNPVGIRLEGFDYDLLLNNASFLKGRQDNRVKLDANGRAEIPLPISLTFEDIYNTVKTLKDKDQIHYALKTGLNFNLPVLGTVRIPVQTGGKLPSVKLPSIELTSINVDKIDLTSAKLTVKLKVDNPNAFKMMLKKVNLNLDVAGQQWLTGARGRNISLNQKAQNEISIPIQLNLMEMGGSVLKLLTTDQKLDYKFSGNTQIDSTLDLLKPYHFNFDKSGKVVLFK